MTSTSLAADSQEFSKLRPDLLPQIRAAELEFRGALTEMIAVFPAHLAGGLQPIVSAVPSRFIQGLLPFFAELSNAMDVVEMVERRKLLDADVPGSRDGRVVQQ